MPQVTKECRVQHDRQINYRLRRCRPDALRIRLFCRTVFAEDVAVLYGAASLGQNACGT